MTMKKWIPMQRPRFDAARSAVVPVLAHRMTRRSPALPRCIVAAGVLSLQILAGCTSGPLPPVFGAVFGLENAETIRYQSGKIPEATAGPGDRVLGLAANAPGQCVYQRAGSSRRFIADCPEGYDP